MKKRDRRSLTLWSLVAFLVVGLLCGCGSGTRNDRKTPSAAAGETEEAVLTADGGPGETEQTAIGGEDKSAEGVGGETASEEAKDADDAALPEEDSLSEDGSYTSKEDVALYLHTYGHLPDNFIRKNDAKQLGWDNSQGNLAKVAPGKSIGGDRFGNYEGLLPEEDGRKWTECDIGYEEGYRNGERIVFSNDGLIYYTGDHYKSFERLY